MKYFQILAKRLVVVWGIFILFIFSPLVFAQTPALLLNDQEYFEMQGLNVMVFHDFYPEGHQGGISIIQNGVRVATNGDLRLEPAPGQWQPIPKVGKRIVDRQNLCVRVPAAYPNPDRHHKGFNPIHYPDLHFKYQVKVQAEGATIRIRVDLEEALPAEWIGRVGFNLELFPGILFGKMYSMDEQVGLFPRQLNGPLIRENNGSLQVKPLAVGKKLVVAPECAAQRLTITTAHSELQLLDGRAHHNNGWFIVRTPIPANVTQNAVEWLVTPNVLPDWQYEPVIHISQVGYHPRQEKVAVIECDRRHQNAEPVFLKRILPSGEQVVVLSAEPKRWGEFMRYQYFQFDFSAVQQAGMYCITYRSSQSEPFQIDAAVYERHVWQPTLEYFLPVQMCHVRVNDRYRVWHGACHLDDALMAPVDTLHLDGYQQGSTTLTKYQPLEPVPGLNVGGWHDAGDYDLRVESQAGTVHTLALIYEAFQVNYDQTTIDQPRRIVELHLPDGKPDLLQQIEHGVLTILAGYHHLGRLYRGIIAPTLRQYVHLGDAATMTDNRIYDATLQPDQIQENSSGQPDDRWVFTEINPERELRVVAALAAAARVLPSYDDSLARECLRVAEELWQQNQDKPENDRAKIEALVELILVADQNTYKTRLVALLPAIQTQIRRVGWGLGRVLPLVKNPQFEQAVTAALQDYSQKLTQELQENPFGVPYRPHIWGAGWSIQRFAVHQYYLHRHWPNLFPARHLFNALNFILGCHPGQNTAAFVSGVGAQSLTVAYGFNRADWSYIPGGVASGTAYIRPDFPELKEWPFLWQQTEYVIGGGASHFMFMVLAANQLLAEK